MGSRARFFRCCWLVALVPALGSVGLLPAQESDAGKTLVIGTKQAPPFVMKSAEGGWEGISIDLWKEIAREMGLRYELREMSLDEMLSGVADGKLDAAVAAITITAERETSVDFTHPFYTSGLGIVAARKSETPRWLAVLGSFFSVEFLKTILLLVLVLLVAGFFVWVFERKQNAEQFGGKFWQGLGNGFWFSAVTMTTVGYGDKAPRTVGGRLVALIWMFTSVLIIGSFIGGIASSLTVRHFQSLIQGPDDLPKFRVATLPNTTSEAYLRENRVNPILFSSTKEALDAVAEGKVDAFVYDAPLLKYLVSQKMKDQLEVLPRTFARQDYGIALPPNSPLREPINTVLLRKIAEPIWADIQFRYLGE